MDLRDILNSLSTLSEATKETGKGRVHKAEPGGYGRKYDTDEEGDEKSEKKEKKPEEKKGRGRPKKDADGKKYDTDAVGKIFGVGKPPKKPIGKPSKKHTLKDWIEHVESNQQLNEAEQVTIQPAQANTQVIKQGTKTLGTVTNPQLAQQIKQSIGRGEMTLAGDKLGQEMGEAVRGTYLGKQGYRAPQTQAERDFIAQQIKGNRSQNRTDTRVTGYGSKVAPQRGVASASTGGAAGAAVNVDQSGQTTDFSPGSGWTDPQYQGYRGAVRMGKTPQGKEMDEATGDYSAKKARAGKDIGKPGKQFSKIAADAAKRYGSKERGEKVAGAVLAKLRAKESVEEDAVEESGLQAYLGNKKYGKDGMDALRKAGRDGASKEKMANIRAKYDKMDEEANGDGAIRIQGQNMDHPMNEKAPPGAKAERMVKHIKKGYAKDGKLTPKEKSIAYATAWKAHNKGKVEEDNPVLGKDAVSAKERLAPHAGMGKGPLQQKLGQAGVMAKNIGRFLQGKKEIPTMEGVNSDDVLVLTEGAMKDLVTRFIEDLTTSKAVGFNINNAVEMGDLAAAKRVIANTLKHGDRYKRLAGTLKGELSDYALEEFGFTNYEQSLEEADVTPELESPAEKIRMAKTMKPEVSPFSAGVPDLSLESDIMRDMKFESWNKQLNTLLTEGLTVSSSTGQQGSPDSVTISATDNDAQELLNIVRKAGLGVFGGGEQEMPHDGHDSALMSVPGEEADGHGTEPEVSPEVVGDGDDMLALIKKMTGLGQEQPAASHDYEEEGEEGEEGEESEEEDNEEDDSSEQGQEDQEEETGEESEEEGDESEEEVDEGWNDRLSDPDDYESYIERMRDLADDRRKEQKEKSDSKPQKAEEPKNEAYGQADEGNAFTGALAKAKEDGIQKGETMKVGDKTYPVKEDDMEEGNAFTGKLASTPKGGSFELDGKKFKDTSSIEEEALDQPATMEEGMCNECGMYESKCGCDHVDESFANEAGKDAMAETELAKLKALLAMGNDLHKSKRDQTVMNPTQVTVRESLNEWKKLSGIKK